MFDLIINFIEKSEEKVIGKVTAGQFDELVSTLKNRHVLEERKENNHYIYGIRSSTFDIYRKSFVIYVEKLN